MLEVLLIRSKILVKTGLRIGSNKEDLHIGGIDNPVIRNPLTQKPYIPGSSLKGKMRFLMEWRLGKVDSSGEVHKYCGDKDCKICKLFGTSGAKAEDNLLPTRLIIRDAELSKEWQDKDPITEEKTENAINRIEGKAIHPRTMERIIPGVTFDFEAVLRVFHKDENNKDEKEDLLNSFLTALYLLQRDYLGASGSRGYGKIAFVAWDEEKKENREGAVQVIDVERNGKGEIKELKDYLISSL